MRLVALLAWYDERDEWLDKGIRSLAKAPIDHVVAVDGAYALFPDGRAQSPPSNAETIQRACDETGVGCTIHIPDTVWQGNEIEKRSFLFRLGERHVEPHVDWYWVWDADEQLGRCKDLKPRLEATALDAGDVRLVQPPDERDPATRYLPGTRIPEPVKTDMRMLFRAVPGTTVIRNHYTYVTPDGRVLWGNPNTDNLVPGLDLSDVQVLHKTNLRQDSRAARRIRMYNERDRTGAEDTTCHWCGTESDKTRGIAHAWEWVRHDTGWLLSGGLAPACEACAAKHGTPKHRPMVLTCPQCNGQASRRNPCPFCGTKGYKLHDPNQIQMNLRPAITDNNRQGIKAITR